MSLQIHEKWWTRFSIGLLEDYPHLKAEERSSVMKKSKAVDRFCQGVYIGPGSSQTVVHCMKVKNKTEIFTLICSKDSPSFSCYAFLEYDNRIRGDEYV